MKAISEMLRHKSTKITADNYATVLLEVAREAAEATARPVPRRPAGGVSIPLAAGHRSKADDLLEGRTPRSDRVRRQGLEPRTRELGVRCGQSNEYHGAKVERLKASPCRRPARRS
jgi:hypothetical protein